MTRGPCRSVSAPMPNPARPPITRLMESAVATAPRLQPNASASTGRNTPKAASGTAMPPVTRKRAATISQRRADGRRSGLLRGSARDSRLLDLERDGAVVGARHVGHDAGALDAAPQLV